MADSRFWKAISILMTVGIFYVGHGLNSDRNLEFPSLVNTAKAGGVAIDKMADGSSIAITCSPDGKELYFFGPPEMMKAILLDRHLRTVKVP